MNGVRVVLTYLPREMYCLQMQCDGVSESQFNQVLNKELDQIMEACKHLDKTWFPKFLLIVAQKNHHTKCFGKFFGKELLKSFCDKPHVVLHTLESWLLTFNLVLYLVKLGMDDDLSPRNGRWNFNNKESNHDPEQIKKQFNDKFLILLCRTFDLTHESQRCHLLTTYYDEREPTTSCEISANKRAKKMENQVPKKAHQQGRK